MICPNCGKTVRSKHQCAHCGHVFSADEIKAMKKGTVVPKNPVLKESYDYDENTGYDEYAKDTVNNQEYEREPVIDSKKENRTVARDEELQTQREPVPTPVVPGAPESNQVDADDPFQIDEEEMRRIQAENDLDEASNYDDQDFEEDYYEDEPRRRGGFLSVLWGILKLLIAVAIVFLLFLFGPQLIGKVTDYFNQDKSESSQPIGTSESEIETGADPSTGSNQESNQAAEEQGTFTVSNKEVKTDNYPIIEVDLAFDQELESVDRSTFNFAIEQDGQKQELGQAFALTKDGKNLSLKFNDPGQVGDGQVQMTSENSDQAGQANLLITSQDGKFEEKISFERPQADQANAEKQTEFNKAIESGTNNDVSVYLADASEPSQAYQHQVKEVEAANEIAWFILQNLYEKIDANELTLEEPVELNESLIAQGDQGNIAASSPETPLTISNLVYAMVQENDVTAMNHLIQALGGPNQFNTWLNEHDYFATKVNTLLAVDNEGGFTGATTSIQDLGLLLNKLANDELVSAESDAAIKEQLLNTPINNKYPEAGIPDVTGRYEIASADANTKQNYYAGILKTEAKNYIVVMLSDKAKQADFTKLFNSLASLLVTGTDTSDESSSSDSQAQAEPAVDESSQISILPSPNTGQETNNAEGTEANTSTGNANGREDYYSQLVENTGEYVVLPNRSYVNENGVVVEPKWFKAEDGSYKYN